MLGEMGEMDGRKTDAQGTQTLGFIEGIGLWADSVNKLLIVAMSKQLELEGESTRTNYIAKGSHLTKKSAYVWIFSKRP